MKAGDGPLANGGQSQPQAGGYACPGELDRMSEPFERYSVADKSLEELLRDVDSDLIAGRRTGAYEVLAAAIPIKVAIENERAA